MKNKTNKLSCKYPHIKVKLIGENAHANSIMDRMCKALELGLKEHLSPEEIDAEVKNFIKQATRGTYCELLQTCDEWVDIGYHKEKENGNK